MKIAMAVGDRSFPQFWVSAVHTLSGATTWTVASRVRVAPGEISPLSMTPDIESLLNDRMRMSAAEP